MKKGVPMACVRRAFVFSFLIIAVLTARIQSQAQAQRFAVSIPHLGLSADERVVGFEVHIKSGRVASLPNIPIGWNLTIDNDASWDTSVKALVSVCAASLDAGYFREFMFVEKSKSPQGPFSVACYVITTKDFKTQRHIKVAFDALLLKPVPLIPTKSAP